MADNSKHGGFVFYYYTPSLVAAIIFVVAFVATTSIHAFQMFKKRTWYMIALLVGGLFEIIGYGARAQSHNDKLALGPFIIQSVLLLVAPALFAASIYMILGRIILLVDGEDYAIVRRRWLTKVFVAGDVFSFLVQSSGAGIMAKGGNSNMGTKIIVGGLFLQVLFFGFFIVVALRFHNAILPHRRHVTIPWQKHLIALYGVSLLILIRSVFRIIEYIMGNASYLMKHEAFLYIFDSCLMLGVMVWLNVVHPGEITALMKRESLPVTESHEFTTQVEGDSGKHSSRG